MHGRDTSWGRRDVVRASVDDRLAGGSRSGHRRRWLSEKDGGGDRPARGPRDILDQRYARGEIDRDEYIKWKQDIADR